MKLKLTNEKIVDSISVLSELNNAKLPVKISYAISKNINKIEKEFKIYNSEKYKLINKYGEKNRQGKLKVNESGNVNIKKEYTKKWNKDFKELLEIEIEIEIHMIKLDDLLNLDYSISPAEFALIDFMIEE